MAPHYQVYDRTLGPVVNYLLIKYAYVKKNIRMPTWDDYEYVKGEIMAYVQAVVTYVKEELYDAVRYWVIVSIW